MKFTVQQLPHLFFQKNHKKILIFKKKKKLPKLYLGLLKLQVPLKFGSFFHRPNLPHFVQNYPMDPINPFISVNHVPMEVDTDVSKNVWKINVFKMCFRTQIIQKITSPKNKKKFPFKVKNLELENFSVKKWLSSKFFTIKGIFFLFCEMLFFGLFGS